MEIFANSIIYNYYKKNKYTPTHTDILQHKCTYIHTDIHTNTHIRRHTYTAHYKALNVKHTAIQDEYVTMVYIGLAGIVFGIIFFLYRRYVTLFIIIIIRFIFLSFFLTCRYRKSEPRSANSEIKEMVADFGTLIK